MCSLMCSVNDAGVQKSGENVSEDQLHEILSEVDVNQNAQVDLGEFLQVAFSTLFVLLTFRLINPEHKKKTDSLHNLQRMSEFQPSQ